MTLPSADELAALAEQAKTDASGAVGKYEALLASAAAAGGLEWNQLS